MSASNPKNSIQAISSPFNPDNASGYRLWREQKLHAYPESAEELIIPVADLSNPTPAEYLALCQRCQKANMVIYRLPESQRVQKAELRQFGERFGLKHLDGNLCSDDDNISALQVVEAGRHSEYIPYSNKRLSWHTDGYYNRPDQQIQSVVLHCVSPAAEGGENMILDHELAYIHLRDTNPDYISALMHPQAMTIPANIEAGQEIRAEQTGPVFSIDDKLGNLHMRYSARKRNIVWRDDPLTQQAVACLEELLQSESPYIFRYRLQAGEGFLSNNVLHNRTGFTDNVAQQRLLYRARYFDRIADTNVELNQKL